MPQVKFSKSISLTPYEAFEKLKSFTKEGVEELKNVDSEIKFDVQEQSKCVVISGQKVNGRIKVLEGSGGKSASLCKIEVDVSIAWTLAPFKKMIRSKLEEKIEVFFKVGIKSK